MLDVCFGCWCSVLVFCVSVQCWFSVFSFGFSLGFQFGFSVSVSVFFVGFMFWFCFLDLGFLFYVLVFFVRFQYHIRDTLLLAVAILAVAFYGRRPFLIPCFHFGMSSVFAYTS